MESICEYKEIFREGGGSVKRKKQDTVLDTCSRVCICMKRVFADKCDRREKS